MTRIAPLLILACAWAPSALAADPGPGGDAYRAGLSCFERLDYPCAVELLTAAKGETGDPARRTDILVKLAESHLALDQRAQAVDVFIELLRIAPDYRVEGPGTSPKIRAALEDARRSLRPPVPPVTRPAPPPPPWMEVGIGGGVELLVGADRDHLDAGPVVDLDVVFRLPGPFRVGAGLRYAYHDVTADSSALHLAGGWALAGLAWKIDFVVLGGAAGVGVVRFGVPDAEGRTGLFVPLRLFCDFPVLRGFHVGLTTSPGWVITFSDGVKSSFTLSIGGRLGFLF
jgi:hypothetical protein